MPHTEKNSCGGAYGRAAIIWDFLGQLAGKESGKYAPSVAMPAVDRAAGP